MKLFNNLSKKYSGFTLVELLVAMSIIGILSAIVFVNFSGVSGVGRDAQRQSDLRTLQTAVEQYKNKYGRYPAQGCGGSGQWATSQNLDSTPITFTGNYATCNNYIADIVPEFISRLPQDPRSGSGLGYAYLTNTNGTVYKIMVVRTVESEVVASDHPFKSCDTNICGANCIDESSYAVWGGFAIDASAAGGVDEFDPNLRSVINNLSLSARNAVLAPTINVVCNQP